MSDTSEIKRTRIEPPTSEASEPFWEATKEKRFLIQRCDACDSTIFYPREVCPSCLSSESLSWAESQGDGKIYAASVQEKPAHPFLADRVPYVVALVELDDGIRLMSNVINCAPYDATVGRTVKLTWEPLSDGRHLPQFELAGPPAQRQ